MWISTVMRQKIKNVLLHSFCLLLNLSCQFATYCAGCVKYQKKIKILASLVWGKKSVTSSIFTHLCDFHSTIQAFCWHFRPFFVDKFTFFRNTNRVGKKMSSFPGADDPNLIKSICSRLESIFPNTIATSFLSWIQSNLS